MRVANYDAFNASIDMIAGIATDPCPPVCKARSIRITHPKGIEHYPYFQASGNEPFLKPHPKKQHPKPRSRKSKKPSQW